MRNKLYILSVIILLAIAAITVYSSIKKSLQFKAGTQDKLAGQYNYKGVIRTGGLSEDEKINLGLTEASYQLTDWGATENNAPAGYFLINSDTDFSPYLGKCVVVGGMVAPDWKEKDLGDSYGRSVLSAEKVSVVETSQCQPYGQHSPYGDDGSEPVQIIGTLTRSDRPSPDINYDYQILPNKPFMDPVSAYSPDKPLAKVDIVPANDEIWTALENKMGQTVNISGLMLWGYAESRFLLVQSVE